MSSTITLHDIEANGKTYILEWTHRDGNPEEPEGYITITETCDAPDDEYMSHEHETYDFRGLQ